ncbi:hypothetical protein [Streptosporangium roseum]|uniref:hypothetical protein n=1 Tax=Streptosporangium roseum TaxID=2001 RepID=UPI0004CD0238|nr:hypothetical protein [Streptosporangium roseum]
MTHTEHDLKELLTERSEGGSGGAARLEEILRRGRAVRRRRRAAGTALAACAVAIGVVSSSLLGGGDARHTVAVDVAPTVSRAPERPEPGTYLPASLKDMWGRKMSLIQAHRAETTGAPYTLTFTPTSRFTGFRVTCADPKSWVVVTIKTKHEPSGTVGDSCPSDVPPLKGDELNRMGPQHDEKSAPADWTRKEQTVTVWVLPSDAPVISMSDMVRKGCEPAGRKIRKCDGKYPLTALLDPKIVKRLTAEMGTRPGRWAVGVYDQPAS